MPAPPTPTPPQSTLLVHSSSDNNDDVTKFTPLVHTLIALLNDDQTSAVRLALLLSCIFTLRAHIMNVSQSNHQLEREVARLDHKIKLLIQQATQIQGSNYIQHSALLDEIATETLLVPMPRSLKIIFPYQPFKKQLPSVSQLPVHFPHRQKLIWEQITFILQHRPQILSHLTRCTRLDTGGDVLVEMVVLQLMGDQDDPIQERLLIEMFSAALRAEFTHTIDDKSTLLRGNSPLTNMLTTFARRGKGVGVLKELLGGVVESICSDRQLGDLTFDACVKAAQLPTQELADLETKCGGKGKKVTSASLLPPSALEIYNKRVAKVEGYVTTFLNHLLHSIDLLPKGVRWVARYLYYLSLHRFPDDSDEFATSIVGGFICLRYINPCIVTPQAIQLLDKDPSPEARKTLILVAKIIQQISNQQLIKSTEPHLLHFNQLITEWIPKMKVFLREVTEVNTLINNESLSLNRYLAHNGNASVIQTNLSNVYILQNLLITHFDAICDRYKQQYLQDQKDLKRGQNGPPGGADKAKDEFSVISEAQIEPSVNGSVANPHDGLTKSTWNPGIEQLYQNQTDAVKQGPNTNSSPHQQQQQQQQRIISAQPGNHSANSSFNNSTQNGLKNDSENSENDIVGEHISPLSNSSSSNRKAPARGHGRSVSMFEPGNLRQIFDNEQRLAQMEAANNADQVNRSSQSSVATNQSRPAKLSGLGPLPGGGDRLSSANYQPKGAPTPGYAPSTHSMDGNHNLSVISVEVFNEQVMITPNQTLQNNPQGLSNSQPSSAYSSPQSSQHRLPVVQRGSGQEYPMVVRQSGVIPPTFFVDDALDQAHDHAYDRDDDASVSSSVYSTEGSDLDDMDMCQEELMELFCEVDVPFDLDDVLPIPSTSHHSRATAPKSPPNNTKPPSPSNGRESQSTFTSSFFSRLFGMKSQKNSPSNANGAQDNRSAPGQSDTPDDDDEIYTPQQLKVIEDRAPVIRSRFEIVVKDTIARSELILTSKNDDTRGKNGLNNYAMKDDQQASQLTKTGLPELRALLLLLGPPIPLSENQLTKLKSHSIVLRPKDPHVERFFENELTNTNNQSNTLPQLVHRNSIVPGAFQRGVNANNGLQLGAGSSTTSPSPVGSTPGSLQSSSSIPSNNKGTQSTPSSPHTMQSLIPNSQGFNAESTLHIPSAFTLSSHHAQLAQPMSSQMEFEPSISGISSYRRRDWIIDQRINIANNINHLQNSQGGHNVDLSVYYNTTICCCQQVIEQGLIRAIDLDEFTPDTRAQLKNSIKSGITAALAEKSTTDGNNPDDKAADKDQEDKLETKREISQLLCVCATSHLKLLGDNTQTNISLVQQYNQIAMIGTSNPSAHTQPFDISPNSPQSGATSAQAVPTQNPQMNQIITNQLLTNPDLLQYVRNLPVCLGIIVNNITHCDALIYAKLLHVLQYLPPVDHLLPKLLKTGQSPNLGQELSSYSFNQLNKHQLAIVAAMLPTSMFFKYLQYSEDWVRMNLDPVFYQSTHSYVQNTRLNRQQQFNKLQHQQHQHQHQPLSSPPILPELVSPYPHHPLASPPTLPNTVITSTPLIPPDSSQPSTSTMISPDLNLPPNSAPPSTVTGPDNFAQFADYLPISQLATLGFLLPTSSPYWTPLFPHHLPPSLRVKEVMHLLRMLALIHDAHVPTYVPFPISSLQYPYLQFFSESDIKPMISPTYIYKDAGNTLKHIEAMGSQSDQSPQDLSSSKLVKQHSAHILQTNLNATTPPIPRTQSDIEPPFFSSGPLPPPPPPPSPPGSQSDRQHSAPAFQILSTNSDAFAAPVGYIPTNSGFTTTNTNYNPTHDPSVHNNSTTSRPATANSNNTSHPDTSLPPSSTTGNLPSTKSQNQLSINTNHEPLWDMPIIGRSRQDTAVDPSTMPCEPAPLPPISQSSSTSSINSDDNDNGNNDNDNATATPIGSPHFSAQPLHPSQSQPVLQTHQPTPPPSPSPVQKKQPPPSPSPSQKQPPPPPSPRVISVQSPPHISLSANVNSSPQSQAALIGSPSQISQLAPSQDHPSLSNHSVSRTHRFSITATELSKILPEQPTKSGYNKLLRRSLLASQNDPTQQFGSVNAQQLALLTAQYRNEVAKDADANDNANPNAPKPLVFPTSTGPNAARGVAKTRPVLGPSKQQLLQQQGNNKLQQEKTARMSALQQQAPVFRNSIRSLQALQINGSSVISAPILESPTNVTSVSIANQPRFDPQANSRPLSSTPTPSQSSSFNTSDPQNPDHLLCVSPLMLQYAPDIVCVQRQHFVQRDKRITCWLNRWLSEVHTQLRLTLLLEADDRLTSVSETNVIVNTHHQQLHARVQMYQQYLFACQLGSTQQSTAMSAPNNGKGARKSGTKDGNGIPVGNGVVITRDDEDIYQKIGASRYLRTGGYYIQQVVKSQHLTCPTTPCSPNANSKDPKKAPSPTTTTTTAAQEPPKTPQQLFFDILSQPKTCWLYQQYNPFMPSIRSNTRSYSYQVLVKKGVLSANLNVLLQQQRSTTIYASLPPYLRNIFNEPLLSNEDLTTLRDSTYYITEIKRGEYLFYMVPPNSRSTQHTQAQDHYSQLTKQTYLGNGQYGAVHPHLTTAESAQSFSSSSQSQDVTSTSRNSLKHSGSSIPRTVSMSSVVPQQQGADLNLFASFSPNQKEAPAPPVVVIPPVVFEYDDLLRRKDIAKTLWAQGIKKLDKNILTSYTNNDSLSSMGCIKTFDKISTDALHAPQNPAQPAQNTVGVSLPAADGPTTNAAANPNTLNADPNAIIKQSYVPLPYINRGCIYGIMMDGSPIAVVLLGQAIALDVIALLHRVVEKHYTNRKIY